MNDKPENALDPTRGAYDVPQVAFAAFFGTPLAAFLCIALNYRCFGNLRAYRFWLVAAALVVPCVVYAAAVYPETRFDRFLPILSAFFFATLTWFLQRSELARYRASGGLTCTFWRLLGTTLFSLALVVVLLMISQGLLA